MKYLSSSPFSVMSKDAASERRFRDGYDRVFRAAREESKQLPLPGQAVPEPQRIAVEEFARWLWRRCSCIEQRRLRDELLREGKLAPEGF